MMNLKSALGALVPQRSETDSSAAASDESSRGWREPPEAPRGATFSSILGAIGNTPLVRLERFLDDQLIELYAKLEFANPGGSAKDRPARAMLEEALAAGRIGPDTLIVESSSGNMGIAIAQFCRVHGLRFRCVVDPRAQAQNLRILAALGTEIEVIEEPDPESGDFLSARLQRVTQILHEEDDAYWPNQYANAANPRSHAQGTMREIDLALDGKVDYLFVAVSSTGTAGGCADYLSARRRSTRVIAVDAYGSVLFGGRRGPRKIPGLGAGVVPPLAALREFSQVQHVSDLDCVVGARRLAQREGILAGGSAGGVLEAVRRLAPLLPRNSRCVAILADGGTRYLDTIYDDAWVDEQLQCEPERLARKIDEPPTPGQGNAAEGAA